MIPPEKIETYRKVSVLAERGTPGERVSAQNILAQLEARYPGIREAANPPPPPPPPMPKPGDFWGGFTGARGGGGGFTGAPPPGPTIRDVQGAVDAVRDFFRAAVAEQEAEAARSKAAQDYADVSSRWLDSGDLVVRVKITRAGIRAFHKGDLDVRAVAEQVGADVADEMVAAIEEAAVEAPPRARKGRG
jgi:hypothetical protein